MARNHEIVLWVEWLEKKGLLDQAKSQGLTFPDFLRTKLGLPTRKGDGPKPYEGDPNNAVDVEELAKRLYEAQINVTDGENDWPKNAGPTSLSYCRREAKRRLKAAREG